MIAAKQYIQDVRMRNLRRKVTLSPCFEFASVIIKKILLTNPFDSPFYELLTLLIFASCIDFPPTLSLPAGKGGADKRILPVRSSSFKSRYMKFTWGDTLFLGTQALPGKGWKMATTSRTKYGVFRNNILLSYESCCRRYMSNIIDSSALIFLSLASFFFLSMVNITRHFDWKCHRQLLVTHLWKILLSWLQFYEVERANSKKLQR